MYRVFHFLAKKKNKKQKTLHRTDFDADILLTETEYFFSGT